RAQTPCGWSMTGQRAAELAATLQGAPNVAVVEDDGIGPLAAHPAHSIGTHLPDRTVVVRSYSKAYGPDLRLAVLGGPHAVVEKARVLRTYGTGWTSRILQDALAHLLTDSATAAFVEDAAGHYRVRRTGLAGRLAEHGVDTLNRDGLSLWIPVADETSALVTLAARGTTASPGSHFSTSPQPPYIRIAITRLTEEPDALESTAALIALAARSDRTP
ncbi:MAG TPA: aminotransferase class I/II-fold pyridoxal phosphate-dependent enzyme, partial [Streptomyces sp.]|nr:aminotransferase class I/II-fold pyridoxal phosphate-dependent enzyme [Streptomyces sp.]